MTQLKTQNIYLIGLMGAGKTSIGRNLARQLDKNFFDSDHEIEKRTGVDISTIFSIEGEEGFRLRETDMIRELVQSKGIVLATGGGSVLRKENRQALRKTGVVVYLEATVDILMQRTSRSKNRPLLEKGDRRKKITALLRERGPIYQREADLIIKTDKRSPNKVAREIIDRLQNL